MKKTFIGGILMFTGALISLAILITAALYVPQITAWRGSKLWYAIFGAEQFGNEAAQSLSLGFPFVLGVILFVLGLVVLILEYFKKE
ncbi:hypothetical protein [Paenibacillus contaminans]|uniref:Uncharacterized protein n=1 Tax=Paenibacillus contaminans TaxID=450362 RepID=A0A329MJB5_9BACL|nr:hypothetical protein [Paenibacillus contaminans]RAV17747.1 hypothetical protein DQG23_26875 [Paenibacillus contaminans]